MSCGLPKVRSATFGFAAAGSYALLKNSIRGPYESTRTATWREMGALSTMSPRICERHIVASSGPESEHASAEDAHVLEPHLQDREGEAVCRGTRTDQLQELR